MVPGRGDRTPMSLRSKVFEFSLGLAPTVTIGHVWSTISNLAASISGPSGKWCHLEAHGVGTKLTHLRVHRLSSSTQDSSVAPPVLLSLSSENVRVNCSMKMSALARHAGVRDCAERSRRARRGWAPGVPADVTAECGV